MIGVMCTRESAQFYWQHCAYALAEDVALWQLMPLSCLKEPLPSAALPPDQVGRILGEFGQNTSAQMISEAIECSAVLSKLPKPLHLLFDSKQSRRMPNGTEPHVNLCLPAESMRIVEVLEIQDEEFVVCMATPEMSFVQVAAEDDLYRTVMYGMFLCGMFTYETYASGKRPQRRPLTTIERLKDYIDGAIGMRGVSSARRALRFIVEHAASPLEAKTAMLLCMPLSKGGFGLPHPKMNCPVLIPEKLRYSSRKCICYANMYWPEQRVIVEVNYQQPQRESAVIDVKDKTSIFRTMGFYVQPLSYKTLCNPELTRKLVRDIRDLMRMDRHVTRNWKQEAHDLLRAEVFDPQFGSIPGIDLSLLENSFADPRLSLQ